MQKKEGCFRRDFERLPYRFIQKGLLGEVIQGIFNFILTFYILLIGNNLLELIQGDHVD
jgi:hypothetical protein